MDRDRMMAMLMIASRERELVEVKELVSNLGVRLAETEAQLSESRRRIDELETELSTLRVQAGVRE